MAAVQDLGLGVVGVHVTDDPGRGWGQWVRLGGGVLAGVDPAHAAVPTHVADAGHIKAYFALAATGRD